MTDESAPTSPASAPPEMMPNVADRMYIANRRAGGYGEAIEQAYRDGWNAALAVQPPEPQECNLIGGNDGLWCTVHGAEAPNGICESAPPQPGDAERLQRLRDLIAAHKISEREPTDEFLLRLLDTAQSALAESRAALASSVDRSAYDECDRQLAESRAEVARLASRVAELDNENQRFMQGVARLRSPTTTGEDREAAVRFQEELLECAAVGENTALDMLIEFRAAARSQGVREGIENAARLVETHVEGDHNGEHVVSPKEGVAQNSMKRK